MLNLISSCIISCVSTAVETQKKIMKKMEEKTNMEMKEMIYRNSDKHIDSEVLYHENFGDGTALAVINNSGMNPCAYIQFPGIDSIYDYDEVYIDYDADDHDTYVHGGFTFFGRLRPNFGLDGLWLGWDYAHWDDYVYGSCILDGKKWTTQEIVEEARRVLRYFREGKWHEDMEEDEELTCPCCGAPIGEDWNFCNKCGTKLS